MSKKICCYCGKEIEDKVDFFCGEYSHPECTLRDIERIEKNSKAHKVDNTTDML